MNTILAPDRRNHAQLGVALFIFLGVSLGLTCLHGLVFHLAKTGLIDLQPPKFGANVLRSFGPAIAAVAAALYLSGIQGLRELGRRVIHWRVGWRLYAWALAGPLTLMATTLLVVYIVDAPALAPGDANLLKLAALFFVLPFLDGPLGEEIGWRGWLLPALLARTSAVWAGVLSGLVWWAWHIPLYHADGREMDATFLAKYLVFTTALSMMHTWLFRRSRGSAFLAVVFHSMTNYVVFMSFSLFPALRDTQLDNDLYFGLIILTGVITTVALHRDDRK